MKNFKSLSLILALPLLLTACNTPATPAEPTAPVTPEAPVSETLETEEEEAEEVAIEATADTEAPIEDEAATISLDEVGQLTPETVDAVEGFVAPTEAPVDPDATAQEVEGFVAPAEEAPADSEVPEEVSAESEPSPESLVPVGLTGTFVYDTKYGTPKGVTDLNTTFVVNEGVIQSVELAGNKDHLTSIEYQTLFEGKLADFVVGKSLSDVGALPQKVNGSSLTSTGFNSALELLMNEA